MSKTLKKMPVFFHHEQLLHKPLFEIAFGERILHPETTHRAESILQSIESFPEKFDLIQPEHFYTNKVKEIHNHKMIKMFQTAASLPMDKTFYPYVFPYYRDKKNLDPNNIYHAGAFCFDSGTPLNTTTFAAASWSAACAVEAAKTVRDDNVSSSYALCRPPGHHASKDLFGGYCYFNNAALAVKELKQKYAKICVLDIDLHHGNGTQVLFDTDPSVLTISIHGDPNQFYPYFSGYRSETGSGKGKGFNVNIPLPGGVDGEEYMIHLNRSLDLIKDFGAEAIVIAAGFDTYVNDPIGKFCLETQDYATIGRAIENLKIPTVIVQEGGYLAECLGRNVTTFLNEFVQ